MTGVEISPVTALPSVTLVRSDGSPLAAQLQTVYSGLVRAGSAVLLGPGAELDTEIIARATGNQALARCGLQCVVTCVESDAGTGTGW